MLDSGQHLKAVVVYEEAPVFKSESSAGKG